VGNDGNRSSYDRALAGCHPNSLQAAKLGSTVDTLTLSIEQKNEAEERIRVAGLESRVTVHLLDYRKLPPSFEKAFDAFISIEMVEVRVIKCIERCLSDRNALSLLG
jgi:hypothetical protein